MLLFAFELLLAALPLPLSPLAKCSTCGANQWGPFADDSNLSSCSPGQTAIVYTMERELLCVCAGSNGGA